MSFSYEELAEIRHYIHQHPELSGQEYQTTAFLKERLEELGIRILESGLKTGLIAEIGSGQPVVALRADIDALPILEQTNLPYQSQNPGVMHACGHDFHQTSLLGAAALLKEKEDQLEGTVRLIFQPAEEISEGASDVLATGLLEDVQGIIGFHNIPQLNAARPDLGVDTVTAVTTMVQNLQLLISRTVSPFETAVLSITHLDVGSTWNVLPKSGYFEGTIRSFNPSVQRDLKAHFISIIRHIAESLEVDVAFEWGVTPPVTFNDEELTQVVWEASQGLAEVIPANPSTAGEDFAFYQERIPGVFAFIGSNGEPDAPDLHHDHMTIDDAAFEVSVPYYVENAQALLRYFKAKEV